MDQLEKVLALADSNHEGEALGALRMARRILAKNGLSFQDLARAAGRPGLSSLTTSFFSGSSWQLQSKIEQLQDDIDAHVEQNQSLSTQMEFWRHRAQELEQKLNLNQAETERWKQMARETADRLWELGQMAHAEAALAEVAMPEEEPEQEEAKQPVAVKKSGGKRRAAG